MTILKSQGSDLNDKIIRHNVKMMNQIQSLRNSLIN